MARHRLANASRRRDAPATALPGGVLAVLLAGAALALVFAPAASADTSQSSNWAGYAVHRSGRQFKRVLGTWRQPSATCTPGNPAYSSVWIGLGGYRQTSGALEQIGSEVDCSTAGKVVSSVWYELVPAPSRTIRMRIRPGDELSAAVTVSGHRVQLELHDLTRHRAYSRTLRSSAIDVSSAEWILEAPSECTSSLLCQTLPLADFGTAAFVRARTVPAVGQPGGIADRRWGVSEITLAAGGRHFIGQGGPGASAVAAPSALSGGGSAFTVTYGTGGAVATAAVVSAAHRAASASARARAGTTIVR